MSGRPMPCDIKELGTLFLFEKLDAEQLGRLCAEGRVELFEPGYVYEEGIRPRASSSSWRARS